MGEALQTVIDAERKLFDVPATVATPLVIDRERDYIRKIYKLADANSFILAKRHDVIFSSIGQLWERGGRQLCEWIYEKLVVEYQDVMRVQARPLSDMDDVDLLVWCWRIPLIILPSKSMWHVELTYDAAGKPVTVQSDANGDAEEKTPRISKSTVTRNGYTVLDPRLNQLPKGQVGAIIKVLLPHAGRNFSEEQLDAVLNKAVVAGEIKTKQPILRVFRYYRDEFIRLGVITI